MTLRRTPFKPRTKPMDTTGVLRVASASKTKLAKCKVCKANPIARQGAKVCGVECSIIHVASMKAKADRIKAKAVLAVDKDRKAALKKPSEYANDAQNPVNQYVKWRDWGKPCASCGRPHIFGVTRNASHLKARGSNSFLRFHLWNIHMSCIQCNKDKGGNVAEYIPRLAERIGQEKVDFLLSAPRSREYSIEYLLRLKRIFTKKAKRMMARIG